MFMEYVPERYTPEHWVVSFAAESHPWLFERRGLNIDFVSPVTEWLKNRTTYASGDIVPREWGCEYESQVRIVFFKKSEAEHFMARFHHG